ncbi:MAG: nitrous oxide reductase family maturation protein NosD [Candidatus Lokiarchaeia archaeon]
MRGFRSKGIKVVVLVSVLLLVPAFSFVAVQNNGQNSLVCQVLYPFVNSSSGYPVVSKAVSWGDVTFSNTSSYSGIEVVLNGNLTVANGGSLTLTNVTLRVNCTANGSNRIEVQSGGALYINDTDGNPNTGNDASVITALNPSYRYLFWVMSGATFQMNNSEVHYCGYDLFPRPINRDALGLWINANNTIIENNTFSDNFEAMILYYAHHNTIRNNNITDNDDGVSLYYSSNNNLTGNVATNNGWSGFYLYNSFDNTLMDNTGVNNVRYGFILEASSNNNITGNNATNNWHGFKLSNNANNNNLTNNVAINNTHYVFDDYGFWLDSSSDNNLTDNTAINSEYGFFVNASSDNNDLFGNDAVNCSVAGYFLGAGCVGNDLTGSVVSNFLRIRVVDRGGVPVGGVDVRVASGGVDVYASAGYGGGNESTGVDGMTAWITVPYQRYTGVTSTSLMVEAWAMGYGHRVVDMSSPHTETFTESFGLLPLLLFAATQGSQSIPAMNILILVGLMGIAFVVSMWLLWRLLKRGHL